MCYYLLFVLLFFDCKMGNQHALHLDIHEYRYHSAYTILLYNGNLIYNINAWRLYISQLIVCIAKFSQESKYFCLFK